MPLYEGLYRFSYLAEDYPAALVYLDSLRMTVTDAPTLQHLVFQRSFLSQLQGDFQNASGLISAVASRVPMKGIVQVFDTIYAGYAHYRGFPGRGVSLNAGARSTRKTRCRSGLAGRWMKSKEEGPGGLGLWGSSDRHPPVHPNP